jgi:hypothetical protein
VFVHEREREDKGEERKMRSLQVEAVNVTVGVVGVCVPLSFSYSACL